MKIRKGLIGAGALVAGLLSGPAWAEQSIKARDLIQQIFGVDAETLASAFATAGEGNSILGNVASVVNTVALLGAAIIVLLTLTNGLLQTGEHGKIMGRYSAIWVPLRTMIALGMLTPLNLVGYSVVQAAVLWGGMQGSGFADQGWSYANEYIGTNMRLSAPMSTLGTSETVTGLYQMEVCAAAVARAGAAANSEFGVDRDAGMTQETVESSGWFGLGEPTLSSVVTLNYRGTGTYEGTDGLCGKMVIAHNQGSLSGGDAGLYWQGQEQVQRRNLGELQARLRALAEQVVEGGLGGEQTREALRSAEMAFADAEQRRLALFNTRLDPLTAEVRQNQIAKASDSGWVGAGAWYMTFAGVASEAAASLNDAPSFAPVRVEEMSDSLRQDVGAVVNRSASVYMSTDDSPINFDTMPQSMADSDLSIVDALSPKALMQYSWDHLNAKGMYYSRLVFDEIIAMTVADGTDPIVDLAQIGRILLNAAIAFIGAYFVLLAAGSLVTAGFGAIALGLVGLVLIPLAMACALLGVFLQYVLPAMPYFMWLAGVAGWLLMLVQTVVAAPLWAASHVMPEGEGFAGHRAMNGYMMLIALLARPLLMVVGLVAAMLVVKVVGGVIVTTFGWFTSSVSLGASGANPIHLLAWIFLFVGIFIVLARWSFSLIHLVPDTVLRFIGAATESFGETNIAEQAKNTAHSAYRVVSDAVKIGRLPGKPKGGGSNNVPVSGS